LRRKKYGQNKFMMMKKTILLLMLVCLPVGILFSQVNEDRKAGFQFSFIPPLSTQGMLAPEYTNAVSVNMLAGVSKNVTAFSFSGLGMYVKNDLSGLHFSGLGTYAGNDGSGIIFSGLFNKTQNFKGFQMGGLINMAKELDGFQFGGLINIATDNMKGFQFGGLANIAQGNMKGFQFGGLLNKAGDVEGVQFAGLVNIAKNVKGFQFGTLLNIAESNDYPLGLVNIIKNNGEMSVGITYDEIGSTIVGFRSGGRILYGMIGVGFNHKAKDEKFVTEAGFGAHIPISSHFRINNELKSQFLTDFSDSQINHSSFAIMPAYRFIPNMEVFAGPSINFMYTDNIEATKIFPSHNLWKKYTDKSLKQLFFGFNVGVYYIF